MYKKFVKFGWTVFELCEQTDTQTNRHTQHNTLQPYEGEVIITILIKAHVIFSPHCMQSIDAG